MKKRKLLFSWILRACDSVTGYLFFLFTAALLFMSAFSTCFIDKHEKTYFLPDTPWLKLIGAALAIFALVLVNTRWKGAAALLKRINTDETLFRKLRKRLLLAIWFVLSLWVVCTQVPANADQRFTLLAARSIADNDFFPSGPFGYLYIYNNQIGWTMVLYVFNMLFGELNYVAYQLLNAGIVVLIFKELSDLGGLMGMSRTKQLATILIGTAFVPLALYTSFVYGTIPGLWLSLLAIRLELLYFREGKLFQACLAAGCIALAVLMKMNYLIFMVAMLIYALLESVRTGRAKHLLIVGFMLILYLAQAKLPTMALERLCGQPIPEGCSTLSWIAMGLQDGERPGWYNSYNEITFEESAYNAAEQEIWVKTDIKILLNEMLSHPEYARKFFVVKTASQWNEPSFASVWISINHYQDTYGHGIMTVDNLWPQTVLSPQGNHKVTEYMDYLSFMILVGAILYLLLCSREEHYHYWLMLAMIFIGGFIFHLVWEVKGQYAMPYYVLLLPYTAMGYSKAAECLASLPATLGSGSLGFERKSLVVKLALLFIAIIILWYVFHGTMDNLTCDAEAYYAYLAKHS